jgi:hypothetical protein
MPGPASKGQKILTLTATFNQMKILILLIALSLSREVDTATIDKLIDRLNDVQIVHVIHYVDLGFKHRSASFDTLYLLSQQIDIKGKRINKDLILERLIQSLTDTTKGLAVHFLISKILGDCAYNCTQHIGGGKCFYNGLLVSRDKDGVYHADFISLQGVQKKWRERLKIK